MAQLGLVVSVLLLGFAFMVFARWMVRPPKSREHVRTPGTNSRLLIAFITGIATSVLLIAVEYKVKSTWVALPELPGFFVAMFTVGVHGEIKPFNVVMVAVNALFYTFIVFSLLSWITRRCHEKK